MLGTQKKFNLPDGREVMIETGKLAKQADGSVVVKVDNTMLLATVVSKKEAGENVDFMPLTVDYQEKYASVGRFPGGFFKREARPSEYEILISRLIDRALRPLFPDDYHAEVFVNVLLLSADGVDQHAEYKATLLIAGLKHGAGVDVLLGIPMLESSAKRSPKCFKPAAFRGGRPFIFGC